MKTPDLQKKDEKELHKLLIENRDALRKFRFEISGSRTRNVRQGRAIRKDIARIFTEMNSRPKKI